jgi:hypothetical protein
LTPAVVVRENPLAMPRGDHFARQWRLLQLIVRPTGLVVEEAARELGCAVRTVWRDLRVLQDAGFPIFTFVTQTRPKHDGAFARRPEFQLLFRRLLGRLSALARFHGDGPLDVDFRGLIDAAGHVKLASDETRPTRWARYSARQDRRMQWEGIEGSAVYEGDPALFWPYLVFGQWTHVGSGATFGLGGYRIEP